MHLFQPGPLPPPQRWGNSTQAPSAVAGPWSFGSPCPSRSSARPLPTTAPQLWGFDVPGPPPLLLITCVSAKGDFFQRSQGG